MNVYMDLEDSIYLSIKEMFPDWRVIQAYTNAPDQITPYVAIDVKRVEECGPGYISTLVDVTDPDGSTVTVQDYESIVNIEFIGVSSPDQDGVQTQTEAGNMSMQLLGAFRTPKGYESLDKNKLSIFDKPTVKRIPLKRDTDMYMVWQQKWKFAFSTYTTETQDYIDSASYEGFYTDAGREPDHIIRSPTIIP